MQAVTCHVHADFDALASVVAAKMLYPNAVAFLSGGADRNVRQFLRLHVDALALDDPARLDFEQLTELVVVDTQHAERLGHFAELATRPGVTVHVYDHHPRDVHSLPVGEGAVVPCGATVTLLLERIRERGQVPSPLQATLFALGIYEDTGSLTFNHTTPADAEAVAFLLRQGAHLDLVQQYMHRPLSPEEWSIVEEFLHSLRYVTVHGVTIAFAQARMTEYIDQLAALTHRVVEIDPAQAVFTLTAFDDNVVVVGRSRTDLVNVGGALRELGGGGHVRAGSVVVRETSPEDVQQRLTAVLERTVTPVATAGDIMSHPVHTVAPDATCAEAQELMFRYGHQGLVVAEGGAVLGVVSRKDIDKALRHDLGHAPVRAYASMPARTASPVATLSELQSLMVRRNIGRVPIVVREEHGERLVGIVSRSDILRAMHAPRRSSEVPRPDTRDVSARLREILDPGTFARLRAAQAEADQLGLSAYLVGGIVRDVLLGRASRDLDILVEGDGIAYATGLARRLGATVQSHERFRTAVVTLPDGAEIDVASARREFYGAPAALPEVERSSLRDDLCRRDFTINAMAVQLNGAAFGNVLDFFGGLDDLSQRLVRVLHSVSFIEDPTRMFRAVRFEQRLGFRLEEKTEALLHEALKSGVSAQLSGPRVQHELLLILDEDDPARPLERLNELGLLKALHPELAFPPAVAALIPLVVQRCREGSPCGEPGLTRRAALLAVLLSSLPPAAHQQLLQRLQLPVALAEPCIETRSCFEHLSECLPEENAPKSKIYTSFASLSCIMLINLWAVAVRDGLEEAVRQIEMFMNELKDVSPDISGDDLVAAGFSPSPAFGSALAAARAAKLDSLAPDKDAQLQVAIQALEAAGANRATD